jgi:hypothetical protein
MFIKGNFKFFFKMKISKIEKFAKIEKLFDRHVLKLHLY